ncbi:MAG: hypothetical protein PHU12_01260 [Candidatus Aenigmarchaeota archaeon]|nr:hypothetical protein [Candidatus Aenigmarchaeota archaeon]
MALKQVGKSRSSDITNCPRCGGEAVFIDGKTIKWLTCTKCKFKKVMEKEQENVQVIPLKTDDEAKSIFRI